jgi:general secretion pathway protein D
MIQRLLALFIALQIGVAPVLAADPKKTAPASTSKSRHLRKQLISFNFNNEDLTTIINFIASKLEINFILPLPPNNIQAKVSLHHQKKVSIEEAFTMLSTLLNVAGYGMTPRGQGTYLVNKTDNNTSRDALPTFIGIPPKDLPSSDQIIRYVYFFDNIKITAGASQAQEIKTILEDMLVDSTKPLGTQIVLDASTNAVIITAPAYSTKVAMQIITELDKTGFREVLEVIKLTNTSAGFVGKFLSEQLLAPTAAEKAGALGLVPPSFDTSLFSRTTKIIADERANSLILLGRSQAIERLKEFIYRYIDVPLEAGESILHVYDLQYLDAQKFVEDLRNIIKPVEGSAQAIGASAAKRFAGVIIEAEAVGELPKIQTQAVSEVGQVIQGGNRLIIAAKKQDWIAIKQLIDDLDKPQPQVLLDVLVVDVTLLTNQLLGSQVRNKVGKQLPKGVDAQFSGLNPIDPSIITAPNPLPNPVTPESSIDGDLTKVLTDIVANSVSGGNATAGSFLMSLRDGTNGLWYVLQILDQQTTTRVLSHPTIMVANQQQATVKLATDKLITGPVKQTSEGNQVQELESVPADLTVEILPRINSSNAVNLQIVVRVRDFIGVTNNRTDRQVVTNATVGNNQVLALGGLIKNTVTDTDDSVPLLGSLPLIGWAFKSRGKNVQRNNLMIFIAPKVIRPKKFESISRETSAFLEYGHELVGESELFHQLNDPISRWFFTPNRASKRKAMLK